MAVQQKKVPAVLSMDTVEYVTGIVLRKEDSTVQFFVYNCDRFNSNVLRLPLSGDNRLILPNNAGEESLAVVAEILSALTGKVFLKREDKRTISYVRSDVLVSSEEGH